MRLPSIAAANSPHNAHDDIEMGEYPTSQRGDQASASQGCPTNAEGTSCSSSQGRNLAIDELLGLQNQEERNKYPGVDRFFRHLEKECFPQFAEFDEGMWRLMKVENKEDHSQLWEWCAHVIQTCRRLENSNPTVGHLAAEFLSGHGKPNIIFWELDEQVQFEIVRALLHTLCWLSATIMPVVEKQNLVEVRTWNGTARLPLKALYNGKIIRYLVELDSTLSHICHQIDQAAVPVPIEEVEVDRARLTHAAGDVLHEPCVTYASLRRYAGVRLKWASTLSEHLSLDRDSSVLSVFRYPSVCAVRVLNRNRCQVIANITNSLLPRRDDIWINEVENEERVCQQVMLSYRLLFGQSKTSRDRLNKELTELVELAKLAKSKKLAAAPTPDDSFLLRRIGNVRNTCKAIQSRWIKFWLAKPSSELLNDELDKLAARSMPDDLFLLQCIDEVPSSWKVWAGLASPDAPFSAAILPARYLRHDGSIKEWSMYFAWIHFTSFRWRLLAIQTFGNDHPPTEFLESLMDPRDPRMRATIRVSLAAVVLAILFGTIQTSIGAQQLVEMRSRP